MSSKLNDWMEVELIAAIVNNYIRINVPDIGTNTRCTTLLEQAWTASILLLPHALKFALHLHSELPYALDVALALHNMLPHALKLALPRHSELPYALDLVLALHSVLPDALKTCAGPAL
jgi:hypothetical protein